MILGISPVIATAVPASIEYTRAFLILVAMFCAASFSRCLLTTLIIAQGSR
jgi:hypothetical protein